MLVGETDRLGEAEAPCDRVGIAFTCAIGFVDVGGGDDQRVAHRDAERLVVSATGTVVGVNDQRVDSGCQAAGLRRA